MCGCQIGREDWTGVLRRYRRRLKAHRLHNISRHKTLHQHSLNTPVHRQSARPHNIQAHLPTQTSGKGLKPKRPSSVGRPAVRSKERVIVTALGQPCAVHNQQSKGANVAAAPHVHSPTLSANLATSGLLSFSVFGGSVSTAATMVLDLLFLRATRVCIGCMHGTADRMLPICRMLCVLCMAVHGDRLRTCMSIVSAVLDAQTRSCTKLSGLVIGPFTS